MAYANTSPDPVPHQDQVGLGAINADEVPGLPTFGPGISWPDFITQAREAFMAYATRNTGGTVKNADEWNAIMEQAGNWATGQLAKARISGLDMYIRAVEGGPNIHFPLTPNNTAVPAKYRRGTPPREYFLSQDVEAAWEAGEPITYPMWEQGAVEWAALQRQEAAEEAARLEAEAVRKAQEAVEQYAAAGKQEVVEATPTAEVTSAKWIDEDGTETELEVDEVIELPTQDQEGVELIDPDYLEYEADQEGPTTPTPELTQDGDQTTTPSPSSSPSRAGFDLGKEGLIIGALLFLPFLFRKDGGGPRRW